MRKYYTTEDRDGSTDRILIHSPEGEVLTRILYWECDEAWAEQARAKAALVLRALNACGPGRPGRSRRRRAAVATAGEAAYHAEYYEDDYESYWSVSSRTGEKIAGTPSRFGEPGNRAADRSNTAVVVDALNAFHQGLPNRASRALRSWLCKR